VERTALEALRDVLDPLGIRWVLIGALAAPLDESYVEEWAEVWDVLEAWRRIRGG
jgi:hypothetical protein